MRTIASLTLAAAIGLVSCTVMPPGASTGGVSAQQTVTLGGTPIEVFTYRPTGCAVRGMLLVFHGLERNVVGYRDDAVPLAQRECLAIAAPLFDEARFPSWSYQRGGVIHQGALLPADDRTVRYVPLLAAWMRQHDGWPGGPVDLIGHSAGAQFLSRVAAYSDPGAARIVLANPSTWVMPDLDTPAPYGFGGIPDATEALRRYLAAPVTVLLGREDRGAKHLATSDEAEDQGANRFERGRNVFAAAKAAAAAHGWPCNWTLAVVPGVGHSARAMFTADAAFAALR